MNKVVQCYTCGGVCMASDLSEHTCPPKYEVWCLDEDHDSVQEIRARSHKEAAEKWAARTDEDFLIARGETGYDVYVRKEGECGTVRFSITVEFSATYTAHMVGKELSKACENQ